ncbi:sulfatase-like hydrolase/transferase [Streptomyces formicae]|uniref:Sulfatase-like hydrolase/transferase n=1 Tax=Streptomyces formicae TaxID=1616117 RepID=A0ABY3WK19_9ACTN|nr:sulfatase-like hydrolase/transferase [Streptomyces formicae]UNM12962.1 sulfatase-like hydrolase/transferase [Streptomyces formicae]
MPSRRQFLAGSTAALALSAWPPAASAHGRTRPRRAPNIVVVLADDLGYGHLGAYGQQLIRTPRLDALAAEGLRFTQAYSAAAVCAPSRASLLTGLHGGHATVRENPFDGPQGSLGEDDITFAEVLRARGYRTACVGKWGYGPEEAGQPSHPNSRGFEEFYGYITHGHAHQFFPAYLWHNGERVEFPENAGGNKGTYAIDVIQERANAFITEHADEPFLLYLTPNVPHAPSEIPDTGEYGSRPWKAADKGHAAQVSRLDTLVGSVVDTLRALRIDEDTLLLVTSDNGPHEEGGVDPDLFDANGPLKGYKRNLFEGGVRVPLIAWQPGTIAPDTTDRPTPLIDLLPTFAELADAPAPRDIDGLSAAPLLASRPRSAPLHRHLYWYRNDPGSTPRANAADKGRILTLAEAVRRDDWKGIRFAPGRDREVPDEQWQFELYDLTVDPGETTDVAAAHPDVVRELTALLRASWADTYERERFGVRIGGTPEVALPGEAFTVAATLGNASDRSWTGAGIRLVVPDGWRLRPLTPRDTRRLAPGSALESRWEVTAPAVPGTAAAAWTLRAEGTATYGRATVRYRAARTIATPPPAPARDAYLSDLAWLSARNGWGPVELDASNGKKPAGDGTPISFGGTTYAKGLGVHAPSEIVYYLGGRATRFTSVVGIDDFSARQNARGGVVAEVRGDGRALFDSGLLTAAGGPRPVDVDVTGVRQLSLVVRDANNDGSYDHTSWADAHVRVP